MVFDDVTHGERVFSETQREKAKRQYETDIVNAGQPNTNYIFVGTTIHKDDLVTNLAESKLWESKVYPAIEKWPVNMGLWNVWEKKMLNREDPNAEQTANLFYEEHKKLMDEGSEVLWKEREPLLFLMKLRLQGRRSFDAEKQMKPFLSGESLFKKIHWFNYTVRNGEKGFLLEETGSFFKESDPRWQIYYALDPATGEKKTQSSKKSLSFSSRVIVYRDIKTGRKFVVQDKTNRDSPTQIIQEMIQWHREYDFVKLGVEENLFKDLYSEAVKLMLNEYKVKEGLQEFYMNITPVYQHQPKEHRIYSIEPQVYSGEMLFSRGLSHEATGELENYPNTDHNDFLDAIEIVARITSRKYGLRAGRLRF